MSLLNQFSLFAEYNQVMNRRLFDAAAHLAEEDLNKDRQAYFKSVLGTLNHILVGDIIWLKRFAEHSSSKHALSYISGLENPASLDVLLYGDLHNLREEREKIDGIIIQWIGGLSEADIAGAISYTNMAGDSFNKPYSSLISHLFLHQVHHRGQATTLLSQFGVDFGETDLIEFIDECGA